MPNTRSTFSQESFHGVSHKSSAITSLTVTVSHTASLLRVRAQEAPDSLSNASSHRTCFISERHWSHSELALRYRTADTAHSRQRVRRVRQKRFVNGGGHARSPLSVQLTHTVQQSDARITHLLEDHFVATG
jgi:hypothetical protein